MKKRLPWILLALSVALNVSFVAGFLHVRGVLRKLQTPEGRAEWAADRLKLDGPQKATLERVSREWTLKMRQLQQAHADDLDAFWAEMIRGEDKPVTRADLERLLEVQRTATVRSVEDLHRVWRSLNPDQRQALVRMIREKNKL